MSTDIAKQADDVTDRVNDLSLKDSKITPTVLQSPEDFTVTHPLTHKWTLWYTKPNSGNEDWHNLLNQVVTISTVEEFWGAYNSIPKVAELQLKSDYSFFKQGVRPEWEDPINQKGGKWLFQFKDSKQANRGNINVDDAWLRVLLGIIGGTLDNDQEIIAGAFVNVRKAAIRINVWTTTCDREQLRKVGERFKSILGLTDQDEVEFTAHADGSKPRHAKKFVL